MDSYLLPISVKLTLQEVNGTHLSLLPTTTKNFGVQPVLTEM